MRKIIGILPLFFLPFLLFSCGQNNNTHYVTNVHDGDTFTLDNNLIVRLYGCDTPEVSNQFNDFQVTQGIEGLYGAEATEFTKKAILNKVVKITNESTDKYGRQVARVEYNGNDLAIELVRHGMARVAYIQVQNPKEFYYTNDFDYYRKLLDAQYEAYSHKSGF